MRLTYLGLGRRVRKKKRFEPRYLGCYALRERRDELRGNKKRFEPRHLGCYGLLRTTRKGVTGALGKRRSLSLLTSAATGYAELTAALRSPRLQTSESQG